jgi:hypothetical protein
VLLQGVATLVFFVYLRFLRFFLVTLYFFSSVALFIKRDESLFREDLDYRFYDLMGHLVWLKRRQDRLAWFIECYHESCGSDIHDDLQKDVIGEWWSWYGIQRS